MMFLQEAIAFAKLLEIELDEHNNIGQNELQTLLTLLVSLIQILLEDQC